MKLESSIIQRLQSIVVERVHESVFPLMHFYFKAAKEESGSQKSFIEI